MAGKSKIDLRAAEETVRSMLQENIRVTNAEIGSALGVSATVAGWVLRKLSECGSPDVRELIERRRAEVRSRWWVRRDASPEEIARRIKELAEKLGRVPRIADAGHLAFRAIEAFGTWNAALAAAGLPARRVTLPDDPGERREVLVSALKEA
ncbi:MAG: homing endonuclease associated repeat-containing protein, partial [Arcobacter sp.]